MEEHFARGGRKFQLTFLSSAQRRPAIITRGACVQCVVTCKLPATSESSGDEKGALPLSWSTYSWLFRLHPLPLPPEEMAMEIFTLFHAAVLSYLHHCISYFRTLARSLVPVVADVGSSFQMICREYFSAMIKLVPYCTKV